jgi:hypothetical protein
VGVRTAELGPPAKWALVGFGIGFLWLALFGALFTSKGPAATFLFDYVAVVSCPPLFFGHDYVHAPFWNAAVYCVLSYLAEWARRRRRSRGADDQDSSRAVIGRGEDAPRATPQ